MTTKNQPEQNTQNSEEQVLDQIIQEHHPGYSNNTYYGYNDESLFQRYITNLVNRQPLTIVATILPAVFIVGLIAFAGTSNRSVSNETQTEDTALSGSAATDGTEEAQEVTRINEPSGSSSSTTLPTTSTSLTTDNPQSTAITTESTSTSSSSTTSSRISTPSTGTESVTTTPPATSSPVTTTPVTETKPEPEPPKDQRPTDVCININGTQLNVPSGYFRASNGNCLKTGKLCTINDSGLTEASGLVASIKHAGYAYTHNDEAGPIFAVRISDCKVVAKITVKGLRADPDPEAISIDKTTGKIWFGDIGNGHPGQPKSMTDKKAALKYPNLPARIAVFDEPSKLSGNITINNAQTNDITYQGGMQNSESLLVNPVTGQGYIINKQATSTVYELPKPLKSGAAKKTTTRIPGWVTDASFTNDGKWIFVRYRTAVDPAPNKVRIYDASWKFSGTITVPKVSQGESIAMERSGRSFLVGSEGSNSPLVRVKLPVKYGGETQIESIDVCINLAGKQLTVPQYHKRDNNGKCIRVATPNKIDLGPWKLTLPIKGGSGPLELKGVDLAAYQHSPWYIKLADGSREFYVDLKRATATTPNSKNPRSELREMAAPRSTSLASWSSTSGTHSLLIRQKVTKNTGRGHVVLGQIHDKDDDVSVFRLEGTKLWITNGDETHGHLLDSNVKLGQVITTGFKVSGGKIQYYYSKTGAKNPPLIGYAQAKSFSGAYFKAGNYCQCGDSSKPGYSSTSETKVVIMGLGITHNGKLPDIGGM